ncbi:hypothetical protein AVEN_215491-1 [Araneus ventricosus]|uniref:Uncharacterized protein n=1 Tax=Araneus ventricosus TaxID=182803 RepID=A0A4Y2PSW9_ARAVE|nr:hypothetical protein AVEN_215491-1 [Araneus ventricosus]
MKINEARDRGRVARKGPGERGQSPADGLLTPYSIAFSGKPAIALSSDNVGRVCPAISARDVFCSRGFIAQPLGNGSLQRSVTWQKKGRGQRWILHSEKDWGHVSWYSKKGIHLWKVMLLIFLMCWAVA